MRANRHLVQAPIVIETKEPVMLIQFVTASERLDASLDIVPAGKKRRGECGPSKFIHFKKSFKLASAVEGIIQLLLYSIFPTQKTSFSVKNV